MGYSKWDYFEILLPNYKQIKQSVTTSSQGSHMPEIALSTLGKEIGATIKKWAHKIYSSLSDGYTALIYSAQDNRQNQSS